ncbi:HD domain-containing protein [Methanonatronarchaeum sp. AMET6-2]|uniref:HD domain-containing protein n=1 Tax=Methanonatronarchaeum sp. AMET6-2 TaxID=2933293 RepID=UPI0012086942|nr:HD domain-containing protein [Methanonatronarchaeum sp. AMET6-2]RZN63177.1 MAG: HD domain-containing protein [Methanonatronarchaeia archaeon]UOY09459.1 HD domain-containing protein [Methanonatronarchaeum sp. AMET6-2]
MSKIIKDPVHGYIPVEDFVLDLVDTSVVQRLRRIKQLGFSYLVYPGANHTRFEHSLGAYHLACEVCSSLGIEGCREIKAAALLHDIGHGPFSHTSEEILVDRFGRSHEDFAEEVVLSSMVGGVLDDYGLDLDLVVSLIRGEEKFGQIISSELDVDRMDYLVRDAHYTGVAYGTIDYERLINEMSFVDGDLIVNEGGLQAAESLLVSRFLMQPTVYFHHASRIAENMVMSAVEVALDRGLLDGRRFRRMFDFEVLVELRDVEGLVGRLISRVMDRDLYKRALEVDMASIDFGFAGDSGSRRVCENRIAEEAGVRHVIIDFPPEVEMEELKTKVLKGDCVYRLDEISRVVGILDEAQSDYWKFRVYSPEGTEKAVREAANYVLGVDGD